jgi:hypothetical protein
MCPSVSLGAVARFTYYAACHPRSDYLPIPRESLERTINYLNNHIGLFQVNDEAYRAYRAYRRHDERVAAALRIVECEGIIVSLNGSGRDLLELPKLLDWPSKADLSLMGVRHDMMPIISAIRWPPDPGTASITGRALRRHNGITLATSFLHLPRI